MMKVIRYLSMTVMHSNPQDAGQMAGGEMDSRTTRWLLAAILFLAYIAATLAQNGLQDINYGVISDFEPVIKDAVKLQDLPEIKDSVSRIGNIRYGILSKPMEPHYEVRPIEAARLQNEPLPRLYHSLLKAGYGPIYNMPFAEFNIGSTRSRHGSYGASLRHLSSTTHLSGTGYGGFSENSAGVYGKKFYKKHTLSGEFNYRRDVVHYYGYDTTLNKIADRDFTRQRYQIFEPKLNLVSHYSDSNKVNHDISLSYYNLQNLHREMENNVRMNATGVMFINREKLNVDFLTDYYNHRQSNDTLNDLIVTLSPYFEAGGKRWKADVGIAATIDYWQSANFYFYPRLNIYYHVYEDLITPYAGVNGGLIKNSLRSLSNANPFVDTTLNYMNTNNSYNLFGGLRGNLSSNTSFDARVAYSRFGNLNYFVIDYSGPALMNNRFNVIYDNTNLLTMTGEMKFRQKEKLNLSARGNYYIYKPANLARPYHKPELDLTLSGIYNLRSKIILRADVFVMGKQWALTRIENDIADNFEPVQLKGWADINLGCEYRYSKMMSFFLKLNNLANSRYYRWERYPVQRFNFMLGLTFVPF